MKISRISISNFRSIRQAEFGTTDFNVLVGRNNHGKSNLLEALEWFYSGKGDVAEFKCALAGSEDEVVVEVEFRDAQAGINLVSNADNRQKVLNIIGESDTLRVRRTSEDAKNRYLFNPQRDAWQKQPTGADPAFNNCIPRFEFVLTDKSLKDVSAFKNTTPIGQMLSSVVSEALEKDQRYLDFKTKFEELFQAPESNVRKLLEETSERVKAHLAEQFPDCKDVKFEVEVPPFDDFLKGYSTSVDDGVSTKAEAKGDGMQRALMLAIIKAHADVRRDDALGKAFVFFIDEAELHLHPTAQRQLKTALENLASAVDQVFLTSHSSVFIADNHPLQSNFIVEKEDGETSINAMSARDRRRTVYDLLGGSPTDLLLPANFLIVEGPSEVKFLEQVCARHYPDKPRIQVVAADGDDERQAQYLSALMKAFAPLSDSPIYREKVVMLFDAPTGGDKVDRLDSFLDSNKALVTTNRSHVLPTLGLEEYYPADIRAQFGGLKQKVKLASKVGKAISKDEFENQMPVLFAALTAAWIHAY